MTDATKPPEPPASDPLPPVDDEEAPVSGPRTSSPPADPFLLDEDRPIKDEAPVAPDEAECPPVTRALLNAFLGTRAAQDRILQVVTYRCAKDTPRDVIEDLVQRASLKALTTKWLPRSVPRMRAWLSRLTQNEVVDYFREENARARWFDRKANVEELPPDPASEGDELDVSTDPSDPPRPLQTVDDAMLCAWLATQKLSAADQLTLEMLRHREKTGEDNAQVAARFGMSLKAFESRLQRFKAKWGPRWSRERARRTRTMVFLWLVAGLALGLVAWLLWKGATRERVVTRPPVVPPVPSASASSSATPEPVEPPVFNQAAPTDGGTLKPGR